MKFNLKSLLIVIAIVAFAAAWLGYSIRANANFLVSGQVEIGVELLEAMAALAEQDGGSPGIEAIDEFTGFEGLGGADWTNEDGLGINIGVTNIRFNTNATYGNRIGVLTATQKAIDNFISMHPELRVKSAETSINYSGSSGLWTEVTYRLEDGRWVEE